MTEQGTHKPWLMVQIHSSLLKTAYHTRRTRHLTESRVRCLGDQGTPDPEHRVSGPAARTTLPRVMAASCSRPRRHFAVKAWIPSGSSSTATFRPASANDIGL